ncbi:MAG: hypothetical protein WHS44_12305 [Fimbriimonadales bacterium]|nr:MAG: hypothetical protein KatS3mg018_2124 [Fimbriimonadales bacterium]
MATSALERLKEAIEHLSPEEQQELMAHLKRQISGARPRRKWAEIAGKAPYPLAGEDAQEWVSHTRRQASHRRDRYHSGQPWKGSHGRLT